MCMDITDSTKAVVLLSGGMDSSVLLGHLLSRSAQCRALSILYGQRHKTELEAAARIARYYNVPHTIVDLSALLPVLKGSSQTDSGVEVPHGHYADESMKVTVVPNRNMMLLSIAIAEAISNECNAVAYAAHAGDHAIYPDCRPDFANAMSTAAAFCHYTPVYLMRPFIGMTKANIAHRGHEIGVPLELTYSCYEGKPEVHCGKCGTCVERREAFKLAGVTDPTTYEGETNAIGT